MIPAPPLLPGDPGRIGRYTLLARLGHGGMGVVYLGRDRDGRMVAIKVIRPELAANPDYLDRFRREVELGRRVDGRFVAEVLDAGVDADRPYLVTAYIRGTTLQARVREHGPMPSSEVRLLAFGMAAALSAIHAAGLVHRDLKPGNVLLSAEGPRVIDFGVAGAVRGHFGDGTGGVQPGTPEFMAPEHFDGDGVGPAADVFAWGGSLVYASTGRPPFGDKAGEGGVEGLQRRVRYQQPHLGKLDSPLRELVVAAMAKLPSGRPTAQALVAHLLDGGPSTRDLQHAANRPRRRRGTAEHPRRRRVVPRRASLSLVALAGSVAVVVAVAWTLRRGIAAHLAAMLVVGFEGLLALAGLLGGGWALTRLARRRLDLSIALGLLLARRGGQRQVGRAVGGPLPSAAVHVEAERRRHQPMCRAAVWRPASVPVPWQVTMPLATEHPPALPAEGGRVLLAWTGAGDRHIHLRSSTDGRSFGGAVTLPATSSGSPALVYGDGRLLLAWRDPASNELHLATSRDGARFGEEVTLQETSDLAPSLRFADGTWVLAWIGRAGARMNLLTSRDGVRFERKTVLGASSRYPPALTAGEVWVLAWTRSQDGATGLLVSRNGATHFVNELALDGPSGGPSLAAFGGHVLLAWHRSGARPAIHIATVV
jgi:hypothetical protein